MRRLRAIDWLVFVASAPMGFLIGALAGYLVTAGVMLAVGHGTSHNDIFTLFGVTGLIACLGFVGGPVIVWRRWRAQSPF